MYMSLSTLILILFPYNIAATSGQLQQLAIFITHRNEVNSVTTAACFSVLFVYSVSNSVCVFVCYICVFVCYMHVCVCVFACVHVCHACVCLCVHIATCAYNDLVTDHCICALLLTATKESTMPELLFWWSLWITNVCNKVRQLAFYITSLLYTQTN